MAAKKVGTLIKEARAEAGLTQEQLARKIDGVSASDVGKVERGEKDMTQAQLRQCAKALGITQSSLLNAPKNVKTTSRSSSSTKKKTSSSGSTTSMKVSASEKKLIGYYREASPDAKKAAVNLLKGSEKNSTASDILGMLGDILGDSLGGSKSKSKSKSGSGLTGKILDLFSDDGDFDFLEILGKKD